MVSEFCKLPFKIFNMIAQVLLQFSNFLCSTVYLPSIIINTNGSILTLKTFPGKVFPQTLTQPEGSGV